MVKGKGMQALEKANLQYITALTDPQIRSLLGQKILQLELFSEQICEVEGAGVRYVLRKNEKEAARELAIAREAEGKNRGTQRAGEE